jgi:transcriptional regulator with XRE-family HTH domain
MTGAGDGGERSEHPRSDSETAVGTSAGTSGGTATHLTPGSAPVEATVDPPGWQAREAALQLVRDLMVDEGVTHDELARRLGTSRTNVGQLLANMYAPTIEKYGEVIAALGHNIVFLSMPLFRPDQAPVLAQADYDVGTLIRLLLPDPSHPDAVQLHAIGVRCAVCGTVLTNDQFERPYWFSSVEEAIRFLADEEESGYRDGWTYVAGRFRCGVHSEETPA